MRLFSFVIIFVFPAFVFASSPDCLPQDDSCSVRIKHSSECIQKCEQGLYKAGQLISDREWNSFIEKMINSSPTGTKDEKLKMTHKMKKKKIPDDSCAMSVFLGTDAYYRCDEGIFLINSKNKMSLVGADSWIKLLELIKI
jgi:hypothetical protein